MHPIKKSENSAQKTAERQSKQTVLDQTRQDHRKSGDRLIATKPLSTVLVIYSNVDNSLLSKLDELRVLIHTNKYDIITLTEIKPKHGTLPDPESLQINGYTLYLGDLANTNSRGVCCYVNDKFSSEIILTPGQYKDSVWVRLMVDDQSTCLVGCVYRSGSPVIARTLDSKLHETLQDMADLPGYKRKIIMGDFNLNRIVWNHEPSVPDGLNENAPERLFIDCLQDTYLHQHVTQPTRFREGQRPTCDDLILTTDEGDISDISYSPGIGKSDHIRLQFYLYTNIRRHYATREYRLFDKADYSKMREMMLMINWTQELQVKSPQRSMNILTDGYLLRKSKHLPMLDKNLSG